MTQLWMDGFDHYGGSATNMTEGVWAALAKATPTDPSFGARTGTYALRLDAPNAEARRALGATISEVFIGLGFYTSSLPTANGDQFPFQLRTTGNSKICSVSVRADGGLQFRLGAENGAILGETTGPVLVAGTWHHIECRFVRDAVAGIFEARVDGVVVLSLTALALGADDFAIFACGADDIFGADIYIDDLIVRDELGTVNNGFEGDLRVATLNPVANGVNQGWAARSIQKLSTGVMSFLDSDNDMGISYADNAAFEIGAGDFCTETFVRFTDTIGDNTFAAILSKWRETGDERSWRLILEGANLSGNLIFETSTDGTSGDVSQVHAFPFVPVTDRWYHIAVARSGGVSKMFLDGVQIGLDAADVRNYDDNAASLFVNGSQNGISTTFNDESVDGWMDGVRFTVGAARYIANFFVPTDALPDDVGGDPLYASVELLLNFDDVDNTDQSSNAFVGVLMNAPEVLFPADSVAYQTISSLDPDDNNFVEAALVPAVGTLTLTGQPLDTETVVLGATTYTFQTVLVDVADNVLIGATASDSLDNLRAAVNLEAGAGTLYGTGTVANLSANLSDLPGDQILATALAAGAAGNTITSTETLTNGSWSAATLLGGLDIPANSEFTVSALPPEVTGVKSVAVVTRSFKTDGGASELTASFVAQDGSSTAGNNNPMTLSPTYYEDTFEVDPSTAGDLTPSSLVGARIRLNRTL